jgi:creatinine deaminase
MAIVLEIGTEAAFEQARKSLSEGGIPIGAALMIGNAVISVGHNRRVQNRSNILHGETDCIERAGHAFDLSKATLFTTLSPCRMCSGAIRLYKIPRVVILDNESVADFDPGDDDLVKAGVEVIMRPDRRIIDLNRNFQTDPETRKIWLGDIGD